ncbi:MAG: MXAN_6640 family putative metalloprotease [Nocardioides sp.]
MRPAHVIATVALALAATVLPAVSTSAAGDRHTVSGREAAGDRALRHADAVLEGVGRGQDATLALRDLAQALPSLGPAERRQARAMLARPTDPHDHFGDSYRVPAKRACSPNICMHWVSRTSDAPPNRAWVSTTMDVMKQVWAREIGAMNYRRPLRDGRRGGDGRLDVYLKDVGGQGLFGYCATERRSRTSKWKASGYCVLDDDFARSQFGAPPRVSLKATAAHEFFHEVQFAYDFAEDAWWMEATATWMEEQVFDGANDNRRYIPFGQIGEPNTPLDEFQDVGSAQYGNWPFFDYVSRHFGREVVRSAWQGAAAAGDDRGSYSIEAIKAALPVPLPQVFGRYAAANTQPSEFYPEGSHWKPAPPARTAVLTSRSRPQVATFRSVDHLASRSVLVVPGDGLGDPGTQLDVSVDGPVLKRSPVASVVVRDVDGNVTIERIPLDLRGDGSTTIPFDRSARVTLANASTRFRCRQGTPYSCRGIARDDAQSFTYTLTVH